VDAPQFSPIAIIAVLIAVLGVLSLFNGFALIAGVACLTRPATRIVGMLSLIAGVVGFLIGIPITWYFQAAYWLDPPLGPIVPTLMFCLICSLAAMLFIHVACAFVAWRRRRFEQEFGE